METELVIMCLIPRSVWLPLLHIREDFHKLFFFPKHLEGHLQVSWQ